MAKSYNQKLKILYLMDFLLRETDSEHVVSMKQILEEMEKNGISAARKSVYNDLSMLKEYGMDIEYRKEKPEGYFLANRTFELPELKLLVDAVQASRFITTRKSRELIKKLETKAGKHDAGKLQRQVYVAGRIKTENESIYYSIDTIHKAIQENRQICFTYMDWNLKKQLVERKNGFKQVSPWALIWREENYYLAAFEKEDGIMKHYRVDKMGNVEVLLEPREGMELFAKIDPAVYTNRTFGMYGGQEQTVTLRLPNKLIGVVMDRFGKEADIREDGKDFFLVRVSVAVSGQFFGWLAGIGKEAQLIKPEHVKEEYKAWLMDIIKE